MANRVRSAAIQGALRCAVFVWFAFSACQADLQRDRPDAAAPVRSAAAPRAEVEDVLAPRAPGDESPQFNGPDSRVYDAGAIETQQRRPDAPPRDPDISGTGPVAEMMDDAGSPPSPPGPIEEGRPHERTLCSGCPSERRDRADRTVRVHHIHLNVKSARETIDYYRRFFGTMPAFLNGKVEVIWAEPLLLLLDEVDHALPDTLQMGLEHFGMGSSDPASWFEQASSEGVVPDTRSGSVAMPVSWPYLRGSSLFLDPDVAAFTYIYVIGPNNERIEVWTGLAQFRHVHMMTPDVDATVLWYTDLLRVDPVYPNATQFLGTSNAIAFDQGVQLYFASLPASATFVRTDDRPLGHIAFSVTNLDTMFDHVKRLDLTVVAEPAERPEGFRSFFLRAPQEVLIEFVEAGPIAFD